MALRAGYRPARKEVIAEVEPLPRWRQRGIPARDNSGSLRTDDQGRPFDERTGYRKGDEG